MSNRPNYDAVFHFGEEATVLSKEEIKKIYYTEETEGFSAAKMKRLEMIYKKKPTFKLALTIWVHCQDYDIKVPGDVYKKFLGGVRKQIPDHRGDQILIFDDVWGTKSEQRIAIQIALEDCLSQHSPTKCNEKLADKFGLSIGAIKQEKHRMDKEK